MSDENPSLLARVATALPVLRAMLAKEGLAGTDIVDELLGEIAAEQRLQVIKRRARQTKIPVDQRVSQLQALMQAIDKRGVFDVVSEADKKLWQQSIQLLRLIHNELQTEFGTGEQDGLRTTEKQ